MVTFTKAIAGTLAAGAMAAAAISTAAAQDRGRHDGRHDGGVSAGEVIAGAVIVGGIAALATSQDRNGYRDGYRGGNRWNNGNPRVAVNQCIRVAERNAGRMRGDVTDIRDVRQTRGGYEVRGRIAVKSFNGAWRGRTQYGNGWNGDYRGFNNNLRGFDSGSFTCRFERGRVVDIDYNGVRGL